ncbi:hypothetical protein [Pseudomonas sp. NPDC096950]|uniref:hypothetical protein n=1 Tax=Pseudomonas sp. NPDC096950 TaxID=3364485 RepID=UPI00383AFE18
MYNASNELQRHVITQALANIIGDELVQKTLEWSWERLAVNSVAGSTFDQAHRPASVYLARMTRHPEFLKLRAKHAIPENAHFHIDGNGRVYQVHENSSSGGRPGNPPTYVTNHYFSRKDITRHVASIAALNEDLQLLTKMASTTAGFITSNGRISLGQWLQFHHLVLPTSEEETKALIDLLNFATLPASPPFENYWQLLVAPDDSPFRLTKQNRSTIRRVTEALKDDSTPLVEQFGAWLMLESAGSEKLPTSQDYRLNRLIEIARQFTDQGLPYLDALDWFNEKTGAKPTQAFIEQLLIAALLLDLDPEADSANTTFAGFDIYASSYLQHTPSQVRDLLEKHLTRQLKLSPLIAPLVAEIILAGMAPEYLVRELPPELRLGTPGWVVLSQAVNLVEALIPGVSRTMTYQHLIGFSPVAGFTPQLESLHAMNGVDPVLTWALMNGVISRDENGQLPPKVLDHGIETYNNYVDTLAGALNAINAPVPRRRALALKELKHQLPDCDPHERLIKVRGDGGGVGRKVSVLDLYMGDELHTQDWNRRRGADIYQTFPGLTRLYPANHLYEEAINRNYNQLKTGLSANIRFAITQLEASNRKFFEHGRLAIFRVQEYITSYAHNDRPIPGRKSIGRYGVIICAVYGPLIRCYELFPLRSECRLNQALKDQVSPAMFSYWKDSGRRADFVDDNGLLNAPLDLDAYFKNAEPRSDVKSRFFIRKLGEFDEPSHSISSKTAISYFFSERLMAISELIAEENPFITKDELMHIGFDKTERELAIDKVDDVFNAILNLIIPFKECIEGLSSGVPSRRGDAISSCVMDATQIAVAFANVPAKIASTVGRTASLATRLLTCSRIVARTTVGLFNPLDGVPHLLKGGAKLVGRALKAGHFATSTVGIARAQLRHLTGADSYDLIRAVNHTGAASEIRMRLDTVAHARTLFKSDSIETAEQVIKHLHANDAKLLKQVPEQELQHLLENSLAEIARQSDDARSLARILEVNVVDSLIRRQAQKYSLANLHQFKDPTVLPEIFNDTLKVENRNLAAMNQHQAIVRASDLGKAPYGGVLAEMSFNSGGLTDNVERATAWILKASNSRNDADTISALLREFSRNGQPLTDPAVYQALHRRLVPEPTNALRSPTAEARYPSNVSGAAMLEKHLATLDPAHEHFGKQMLGSFLGYHSFVDGNGRTARAIYAITELRANRFNALPISAENALSGLA